MDRRRVVLAILLLSGVAMVAALRAAPVVLWGTTWRYGTLYNDFDAIVVDPASNVLVTGMRGVVTGTFPYEFVAYREARLTKLDQNGTILWEKGFLPGGSGATRAQGVAADANGNIAIAGACGDQTDVGGGPLPAGIFLASYDTDGAHRWSHAFPAPAGGTAWSTAAAPDGAVAIVGGFSGSVDFGGGPVSSAGGQDGFVARYDANGAFQWAYTVGDTNHQEITDVAIDEANRTIVVGWFYGTIDLGGAVYNSSRLRDVFVAVFDSNGVLLWSRRAGTPTVSDVGGPMGIDREGRITIGFTRYASNGAYMGYSVVNYDAIGAERWTRTFYPDHLYGLDAGPDGSVFLVAGVGKLIKLDSDGRLVSTGVSSAAAFGVAVNSLGDAFVGAMVFQGTNDYGEMSDIRAERHAFGEPAILSVEDVPGDQGRAVTLAFGRSRFDHQLPGPQVERYDIYLRDDPLPQGAGRSMIEAGSPVPNAPPGRWIFMQSVTSSSGGGVGSNYYETVVATLADSTSSGTHESVYFVRAATADPARFFDSLPDSGRSRDNIPPATPGNFTFVEGLLGWDAVADADFDYYRVYGSSGAILDATAVLLAETIDDSLNVQDEFHPWYHLVAVDFAGNASDPARVEWSDTVAPSSPLNLKLENYRLTWDAPPEPDVASYTVYGSEFDDFSQPSTALDTVTTRSLYIYEHQMAYYFVTATDYSGNEGPPAMVAFPIEPPPPPPPPPFPSVLSLNAFPNPFNPQTTIRYETPRGGHVVLRIYDARGALVTVLVDAVLEPGSRDITWRGTASSGAIVGAGVYFARLTLDGDTMTRKLVLLK